MQDRNSTVTVTVKKARVSTPLDKIKKAMLAKFKRADQRLPGVLANLYLDHFVFETRKISATDVYALGLAEQDTFTKEWREQQKKLGYLRWDHVPTGYKDHKKTVYRIGPELLSYINDAKKLTDELVTMKQFNTQFEELSAKVAMMQDAFDRLINALDNPVTPEKRIMYIENPMKLLAVMQMLQQKTNIVMTRELEKFLLEAGTTSLMGEEVIWPTSLTEPWKELPMPLNG
ncbi:MAG: hypothetical protein EOO46_05965 [Flavobacterium sp.]|nr:MAG: hypothetical protein EOO46_05965 [Flavobacterium sp.]